MNSFFTLLNELTYPRCSRLVGIPALRAELLIIFAPEIFAKVEFRDMELHLCTCSDEGWGDAIGSASSGENGVFDGDAGI